MMVKQLIKELKNMPPNIDVHVALHDNSEYETAGHVYSVSRFIKDDYRDDVDVVATTDCYARDIFDDMPEECVVLRC